MILDLFNLEGKTAIVTGSSAGLGEGMAIALAQAGADVVCVARRRSTRAKEQIEAAGRRCLDIQADLMYDPPVDDIVASAVREFGSVDILVNNAGLIRRCDSLEFTQQDWDDIISLNLKTVFFLSQAAAKQMVKQGKGGKIINTASLLSFQGGIRVPSYTAAKSGVAGLTKLLANEWAKYGICVNSIAPGYMDTDNTEALRNDPVRSREILVRIPMNRWGEPRDMGGAVVFLASAASDYVTGQTLAVDGGWLGR